MSYLQARAGLVGAVTAKGFEDGLCPVGWCHPETAERLTARPSGLCGRHWRKLSRPLQHQLQGAKRRAEGGDERARVEAAKVLDEAVREAKRFDGVWHHWAIIDRGKAEGRHRWEEAVRRHQVLEEAGFLPAIMMVPRDLLMSADQIRAGCPHKVVDATRCKIGEGPTLSKAIGEAYRRSYDEAANRGAPTWPLGVPPTVHNIWTGEVLPWAKACEAAARGHLPCP